MVKALVVLDDRVTDWKMPGCRLSTIEGRTYVMVHAVQKAGLRGHFELQPFTERLYAIVREGQQVGIVFVREE